MACRTSAAAFGPSCWAALLLCPIGLALETALKTQPDEVTIDFRSEGMKRVLIALGIMVVFSVLTYILGFFVGTFFMVISCAILLGERNKVKLLAIPFGVIVFILSLIHI